MVVKIVKLLFDDQTLNFGKYLDPYKKEIIAHLKDCYKSGLKIQNFENFLNTIENYGDIFKCLSNEKIANVEYIYDFFIILTKENEIKKTINKYFEIFTCGKIYDEITINELIKCIKISECYSNGRCDYNKLCTCIYNYSNKKKQEYQKEEEVKRNTKKKIMSKKEKKRNKKQNVSNISKDFDEKDDTTHVSDVSILSNIIKDNEEDIIIEEEEFSNNKNEENTSNSEKSINQ